MQDATRLCCGTWRSSSRFPQPRAENVALFTADSEYAAPGGCVQEVTGEVRLTKHWYAARGFRAPRTSTRERTMKEDATLD